MVRMFGKFLNGYRHSHRICYAFSPLSQNDIRNKRQGLTSMLLDALLARGERIINETSADSRHASRSSLSSSSVFMTPALEISRGISGPGSYQGVREETNRITVMPFSIVMRRRRETRAVCVGKFTPAKWLVAAHRWEADLLLSASRRGDKFDTSFRDTPLRIAPPSTRRFCEGYATANIVGRCIPLAYIHTRTQLRLDDGFRWRYVHVRYFFIPLTASRRQAIAYDTFDFYYDPS